MTRIAIAGMWHETNTYGPHPATLERFAEYGLLTGAAIAERHTGMRTVIGGFLDGVEEVGAQAVPTFAAGAWPSGPAPADTMQRLLARLDAALRGVVAEGRVDAVLVDLHGAMVAEGQPDVETDTLRAIRSVVGPDVPIGAVLDLHANPSAGFVEQCNVVICYDTYPHVDMWERGAEVAALVGEAVAGRPLRTVVAKSPLLTVPLAQATDAEPMRGLHLRARSRAADAGVTRISICAGFAYSDVERAGLSVLAVSDAADVEIAREVARDTARDIEAHAADFAIHRAGVRDAVNAAIDPAAERPVVIADLADNIGGGSAGDGTALLAELLKRGATGVVAIIADPQVVREATDAGGGAHLNTRLGGKFDQLHGAPVSIDAVVGTITDGRYVSRGSYMTGQTFEMGPSAVLDVGPGQARVLVTSRPTPPFHREQLTHAGIDPAAADVIIAKGAIAWRSAYGDDAGTVIEADTPGACPLDITTLTRVTTPVGTD